MTGTLPAQFSFPALLADVGGTHVRFTRLEDRHGKAAPMVNKQTRDHTSFADGLAGFGAISPIHDARSLIVAAAGPVIDGPVQLTNHNWTFDAGDLAAEFGFDQVVIVNDFVAEAMAIPDLGDDDQLPVHTGKAIFGMPMSVIGPGTGFGSAVLINHSGRHLCLPGEAGHVGFAATNQREQEIWAIVGEELNMSPVAEAIISGPGLLRCYRALCKLEGKAATSDSSKAVVQAGLQGGDRLAVEACCMFAAQFGRLAGDLALIVGAFGGVYLTGGMARRLAPYLSTESFSRSFVDHPPYGELLARVPVILVLRDCPALDGLAAFARAPDRFSPLTMRVAAS